MSVSSKDADRELRQSESPLFLLFDSHFFFFFGIRVIDLSWAFGAILVADPTVG
jgi:hypothetical protein